MEFLYYQLVWNTILTIFLVSSAVIFLYIAYQGYKIKNYYGATSTFVSSMLLIVFAIYNSISGLLLWPLGGFYIYWIVVLFFLYMGFYLIIKIRDNHTHVKTEPEKDEFSNEKFYQKNIPLKMEYYRKSFHLAGILLIVAFYGIGFGSIAKITNNAIVQFISSPAGASSYQKLWGSIQQYSYSLNDLRVAPDFTFFALWGTFAFVLFPELIRVLAGAKYSLYNRLTKHVLRGKEYKSVGPQIFLVLGVISSFFMAHLGWIPYEVAIAAGLISCFSDALAAVIGRRFGRHKINVLNGDKKSIEGFVAGVGSAFVFSLIFVGPVYALIAAAIFFLLDYITLPIADNLLNPIILSLVIMLLTNLTGFPVGW